MRKTISLSDISAVKKLAKSWHGLANAGKTIEDIEQDILLAQLEFDAGFRNKDPSKNLGSLYCQIAGDRQISVGGTGESLDEGDEYMPIAGGGIEHIDPLLLLEISQFNLNEIDHVPESNPEKIIASDLSSLLGLTVRQARNIKKRIN